MGKKILVAVAVATMVLMGYCAHAAETTVTGEPVDIPCFLAGKMGAAHAGCAKSCAEKGNPIGIAAKDAQGKDVLYLALGGGDKPVKDLLANEMGKQVKVTGTVADKGGMKVIKITKVEAAGSASAKAWQPATGAGSASIANK